MIRPLRGIGLDLGLRFYLLLIAVSLPSFWIYSLSYTRILRAMHEQEVEDVVRRSAFRIEDELADQGSVRNMGEDERDKLDRLVKRIVHGPDGIERAALFLQDGEGQLQYQTGEGFAAPPNPNANDMEAMTLNRLRSSEMLRGGETFLSASFPVQVRGEFCGVLQLQLAPKRIGLGPQIPQLRMNLLTGAVGIILAVGIGVAFFFHYAVGRPIQRLAAAMSRATEGDLGTAVDIRTGEFGFLSSAFNRMMSRLKSSEEENRKLLVQVKGFNEELREKIAAAIRELASKNELLQAANERLFLLQRQMTTLEKLATLGQIATIIAHELGTPLNAISAHLQLLLQDPAAAPKILERLQIIDGQVDRLTGIVRDVLKAMHVPPPRRDRVRIQQVVADVSTLVAPVAQKNRIAVDLRIPADLPPLSADADQLEQVFMNLFTNAVDAMREGGTLTVAAAFVPAEEAARLAREDRLALDAAGHLRVDVTDTGQGMSEEAARRVFEPFFTTKRGEADGGPRPPSGLGLGLSICRQIVKNHLGDIVVRSAPGKGTTFSIYLPLEPGKAPA